MPKNVPSPEARLTDSLDRLNGTIETLPRKYRHILSPGRNLIFSFLRGIASGLGVLVAVAIIVPLLVTFLRSVNWVPIIGNFVNDVAEQMEQARVERGSGRGSMRSLNGELK
ncbi:MAG: DUF5665 domain-containing protein [Candidatus Peribacteraceae bacterium]|nr:DUF5665 domain-containing protein [Candidatus Peribacteraceae bacterium]